MWNVVILLLGLLSIILVTGTSMGVLVQLMDDAKYNKHKRGWKKHQEVLEWLLFSLPVMFFMFNRVIDILVNL